MSEPLTREELYYSYLAGKITEIPEPITRREQHLYHLCMNGGAGNGGGTAGVANFNGRTGAVTPRAGDYTAGMVGADPTGAANTALTEAKAYTDTKLVEANTYTNTKLTEANRYTDTKHAEANIYADGKLTEANRYTDTKVAELVDSAPETLNTLKEVAEAIEQNKTVAEALNQSIGSKANQMTLEAHTTNQDVHITSDERTKWNGKQDALAGAKGQFLGFDDSGKPIATDIELNLADYEVVSTPAGTLVDYREKEIRVMCPANTQWVQQQGGGDVNKYYIGVKAYAPSNDIVNFKEDLAQTIADDTLYVFEGNAFAGIEADGRKYSIFWLPVAVYDEMQGVWTYSGTQSTEDKYIGWYYTVEWYNADGIKVAADTIRINLTNEDCHLNIKPFYVKGNDDSTAATTEQIKTAIENYFDANGVTATSLDGGTFADWGNN